MNFSRHSRWSGFPDETRKTIYWYEKRPDTQGAGFFAELFTHVGQLGDARRSACSFHQRAVHRRSDRSQGNDPAPGGCRCTRRGREKSGLHFSLERVKKWEKDHGQVPAGAFVAMRTDWSKRWPDAARMENKDAMAVLTIRARACPFKNIFTRTVRSPRQGTRRRIPILEPPLQRTITR